MGEAPDDVALREGGRDSGVLAAAHPGDCRLCRGALAAEDTALCEGGSPMCGRIADTAVAGARVQVVAAEAASAIGVTKI
jgi:hypothetical protein